MIWMTLRRLDWVLRSRGSDLAIWPAAERTAALSLMRRCGRARQVMADALAQEDGAQDDGLAQPPRHDCPVLARMQAGLRRRMAILCHAVPAMRWGALAACAVVGLYLGAGDIAGDQSDMFATVQAIAIDAAL